MPNRRDGQRGFICLTGDVHHMSMRSVDQRSLPASEARIAVDYAACARRNGLKVTLFLTGKALAEEADVFRPLVDRPDVELGGHGLRARRPRWVYELLWRRLLGRSNGPAAYQAWEIGKTMVLFRERLGLTPRCWRDHAFRLDGNTHRLLASRGITAVSDEVDLEASGPRPAGHGLTSLPINVWPDHDCLAHGAYTGPRPWGPRKTRPGFPSRYWDGKEWLGKVEKQVERVVAGGGVATLLVHPACMQVLDGMRTFAELCERLARHRSATVSEAAARAVAVTPEGASASVPEETRRTHRE